MYMTAARKAFLGAPKPGRGALALAVLAFIMTALVAFWNVDNQDGIHCGSWISPNDSHAKIADLEDYADPRYFSNDRQRTDCAEARKDRTPILVALAALTVAALVVGILRRYQPGGGSTPPKLSEPKRIPRLRRDDEQEQPI